MKNKYLVGDYVSCEIEDGACNGVGRNTWMKGAVLNLYFDGCYMYEIEVDFYIGNPSMHDYQRCRITGKPLVWVNEYEVVERLPHYAPDDIPKTATNDLDGNVVTIGSMVALVNYDVHRVNAIDKDGNVILDNGDIYTPGEIFLQ